MFRVMVDLLVFKALQKDGNLSFDRLAYKTGISPTTVQYAVERLFHRAHPFLVAGHQQAAVLHGLTVDGIEHDRVTIFAILAEPPDNGVALKAVSVPVHTGQQGMRLARAGNTGVVGLFQHTCDIVGVYDSRCFVEFEARRNKGEEARNHQAL